MPRPVTAMHGIREALRLSHAGGLSAREVATVTRLGRATVRRCLARASEHGLAWPLPEYMDDSELELRLLQRPGPRARAPAPDWEPVHREARRPGVTLQLLWMEHKERCPDGHQYTWFTQQYREWKPPSPWLGPCPRGARCECLVSVPAV